MSDPIANSPTSLIAGSTLQALMHGGEKGVIVKRINKIGDRPSLYRRVTHRVMVVRGTYDHARLGRNDLQLLLDFEADHFCHPDINDRQSHRIATNVRV